MMMAQLEKARNFLLAQNPFDTFPTSAVVLGSGFRHFLDHVNIVKRVEFSEIPYFHTPNVAGHGSSVCFAESHGQEIVILSGRIHLYEGYSAHDVVFPVRSLGLAGVNRLLLTNAAGGLTTRMNPGDIVVIRDHINLTGHNCLIGSDSALGKKFLDMSYCYDRNWRDQILTLEGVKAGVYLGLTGPNYETFAETQLFGQMGADMVGMSTVQETIAARQLGMKVAALSFITNLAAGLTESVDHQEVLDIAKENSVRLANILNDIINLD